MGVDYLDAISTRVAAKVARLPLGTYPTPVKRVQVPTGAFWVKHDEIAHPRYAGNKLRKLEYLLASAKQRGATTVATFGAAGSNHALATALHARDQGLRTLAFLSRQPVTPNLAATLRAHHALGTQIVYCGGDRRSRGRIVRDTLRTLNTPFAVIPMGGTSWLGMLGFVAGAAELRAQIDAQALPAPMAIVMPLGTMGSVIGLAIGLELMRLPTRIAAVRVVDGATANDARLRRLGDGLLMRLKNLDPTLQAHNWWRRIELDGSTGVTVASQAAVALAANSAGLRLENTYSGKALAALLAKLHENRDETLFWNTYSGQVPVFAAQNSAPDALPPELRAYWVPGPESVSAEGSSGVLAGADPEDGDTG